MSDNHIRGISSTLSLLDEDLCDFEQWANGHEIRSVLYEVRNTLSPSDREMIAERVAIMRTLLGEIRDTLHLEAKVRSTDRIIVSSCAVQWAGLVELGSGYLRRYGELPPGLGEYLDPRVKELNDHLRVISTAAGKSGRRKSRVSE
jgi:hypothetical protein